MRVKAIETEGRKLLLGAIKLGDTVDVTVFQTTEAYSNFDLFNA
jgi:hypothetical protein